MFGNGYFGVNYFPDAYWGPLEVEPTISVGGIIPRTKRRKKKLTEDEVRGLIALGNAIEGVEPIEEKEITESTLPDTLKEAILPVKVTSEVSELERLRILEDIRQKELDLQAELKKAQEIEEMLLIITLIQSNEA